MDDMQRRRLAQMLRDPSSGAADNPGSPRDYGGPQVINKSQTGPNQPVLDRMQNTLTVPYYSGWGSPAGGYDWLTRDQGMPKDRVRDTMYQSMAAGQIPYTANPQQLRMPPGLTEEEALRRMADLPMY
jgi:hypothetical protein